ncbi:MAG: L,D-transpeptidase family protein [Kiritimatiellae bacterium]|nr:L,D-transpeptidase family protein [Kiritimatiellia bacterium]
MADDVHFRDLEDLKVPSRKLWLILLAVIIVGAGLYRYFSTRTPGEKNDPVSVEEVVSGESGEQFAAFEDVSAFLIAARQMETDDELVLARNKYWEALAKNVRIKTRREIEARLGALNVAIADSPRRAPEKVEYVVKSGDSLKVIARKHGTTVELLQRSNEIMDPNRIMAGDRLRVMAGKFSIEVSKARNDLLVLMNGKYFKRYGVATGKYERTPSGTFEIREKTVEPTWWRPDGKSFAFGEKENILGTRWMRILPTGDTPPARGYGIHGTRDETTIGQSVSAGCIRMRNKDVEELYDLVPEGTPVTITE